MKKDVLDLAGGDRDGEKELDSRYILVDRTDWTLKWFGYED